MSATFAIARSANTASQKLSNIIVYFLNTGDFTPLTAKFETYVTVPIPRLDVDVVEKCLKDPALLGAELTKSLTNQAIWDQLAKKNASARSKHLIIINTEELFCGASTGPDSKTIIKASNTLPETQTRSIVQTAIRDVLADKGKLGWNIIITVSLMYNVGGEPSTGTKPTQNADGLVLARKVREVGMKTFDNVPEFVTLETWSTDQGTYRNTCSSNVCTN
jgi:hypothetical protein